MLPMPRWWGSTGTGVLPFAHDAVYFNDEMMSRVASEQTNRRRMAAEMLLITMEVLLCRSCGRLGMENEKEDFCDSYTYTRTYEFKNRKLLELAAYT